MPVFLFIQRNAVYLILNSFTWWFLHIIAHCMCLAILSYKDLCQHCICLSSIQCKKCCIDHLEKQCLVTFTVCLFLSKCHLFCKISLQIFFSCLDTFFYFKYCFELMQIEERESLVIKEGWPENNFSLHWFIMLWCVFV